LVRVPHLDEDGFKEVHAGQAFSIPFENLDIHLGRTISLKPEDLISKIIGRRRGGYCFELNGIFCLALRSIGFKVRPLLARVIYGRTNPGARTHQVLIVTIAGHNWLADNGFGGPGLRLPIPMVPDRIHEQYGERFRLRRDPEYGMVLQKESKDAFVDLYVFDENEPTFDVDIEMANHFTSTWPGSIFRQRRMCALAKSWGRITLSDMELAIYRDGRSIIRTLKPGRRYMTEITQHFGIDLHASYGDFKRLSKLQSPKV
jgi:N-hydroxyarylamine O-acetyltransferase